MKAFLRVLLQAQLLEGAAPYDWAVSGKSRKGHTSASDTSFLMQALGFHSLVNPNHSSEGRITDLVVASVHFQETEPSKPLTTCESSSQLI